LGAALTPDSPLPWAFKHSDEYKVRFGTRIKAERCSVLRCYGLVLDRSFSTSWSGSMAERPSIGSCWRILVKQPHLALESGNYTALDDSRSIARDEAGSVVGLRVKEWFEDGGVFDELVILFDPDPAESGPPYTQQNATCLHLEQMDERNWYLGVGDLKFNVYVKKDTGALEVTLYDGEETEFRDGRSE
jgi:hypothetical protein